MRKALLIVGFVLAGVTAAAAAPIPVTGSYSVSYTPTVGNGPTFTPVLPTNFTENLTIGTTTTATKFFGVTPANSCGYRCPNSTATGTIKVTFNFSAPTTTQTVTASANYMANYSNETDSVTWTTPQPLVVNFTDGSILDIILINAEDWTIYPKIQFDLVKGPNKVPEPGTLALAAAALLGMGFMSRRLSLRRAA